MLRAASGSRKSGAPSDRCGVCRKLREVGNCDFGKGNPYFLNTPHCRSCCTVPDRTHWRPLAQIEGRSGISDSRVRRILRTYATAYARLLGRIRRSGCGQVVGS